MMSHGITSTVIGSGSISLNRKPKNGFLSFFLSIFTDSLIYEHYTRECEFENFDKIKNKKHKKNKTTQKTQKLLAEFLFK